MIQRRHSAFSLVELSIVLVILGLLVGGILGGKSLIRASELRSVTTQRDKFLTATLAFRDKYFMIPGDITNATQFWGVASAINCGLQPNTGQLTCDGNGDGGIGIYILAGDNKSYELSRFWQHLSNAGVIEGAYGGSDTDASPAGKIGSSMWGIYNQGTFSTVQVATAATRFTGEYRNTFSFGAASTALGALTATPLLTNEELWNLDTKMDDGKPGSGKFVVFAGLGGGIASCTSAASSTDGTTATYTLNTNTMTCTPWWRQQF